MNQFLTIFFFTIALFSKSQEINHSHSILHSFIENKGQWDENVLFHSKFEGGNLWVQQKQFIFQLTDFSPLHDNHIGSIAQTNRTEIKQSIVILNFLGSREVTKIDKSGKSYNYYNYFIGNDKTKWSRDVHGYSEAVLGDFYNNIDLKIIEDNLHLKYEFHVKPNARYQQIQFSFEGQNSISIDRNGNLVVKTDLGEIIEEKPYAYQIKNGRIIEIECDFVNKNGIISYEVGHYDTNIELVIDPVLVFATYSGSPTDNFGMTATYGHDGTAYSGGTIFGNQYPTPSLAWNTVSNLTTLAASANQSLVYGITDVFISKYSSDGSIMLWTNFIGGGDDYGGTETVHSLITDNNDNLYFFGATSSLDFPIQNGYQQDHAGGTAGSNFYQNGVYYTDNGTDLYISKLSQDGMNLLGSTYFGGSKNDGVNYNFASNYDSLTSNYGDQFRGEIMLDSIGNCIVVSCTRSSDLPVLDAFQSTLQGGQDGIVFKLSSNLSSLIWSSYYGGTNNDACYSVKIDSSQNIVFSGGTSSNDLIGMDGWQPTFNGGKADGFVVKLKPDGRSITHASYIGTSNYDQAQFVEIDRNDNIFLFGQSSGGLFPVINSGYSNPNSSQFIMKLDSTLSTVEHSTVFGNGQTTLNLSPSAFLVDICGNVYISGWGASVLNSGGNPGLTGMPLFTPSPGDPDSYFQSTTDGYNFYLFVIKNNFSAPLYATYLGGPQAREHVDGGTSRFDKNGVIYQSVCGGCNGNSDFPTTPNAWSATNESQNCNNLIFKFDFQLIPKAEFTVDNTIGCVPFEVTFNNYSSVSDAYLWNFGNGPNDTSSIIFEPTITYNTVGTFDVYLYVTDSICLLTDTAQITITVLDPLIISTSSDIATCEPYELDLTAYSNGEGIEFIWSEDIFFSDTLNPDLSDSTLVITPSGSTTYYVSVSNGVCNKLDSVVVQFTSSDIKLGISDSICIGDQTNVWVTNLNSLITFSYSWSPSSIILGNNTNDSVIVAPLSSQYIYLNALASNGCSLLDSIYVNVGNVPDSLVSATSSEYNIPEGGEVTLSAQPNGFSYSWTPPILVDQPNSQVTTATVEQTTLYTVYVTDGICTKSDTVLVKAYPYVCAEPFIFIPSAFSPNGDGQNDVLYVRGGAINQMLLRIYDRWGELVFESRSAHEGWDGNFRGKRMDPDVYDYYLEVDCIGGEHSIIKGNITLLK